MSDLIDKVEQANARLFPNGERILVAVSGGLDSMVLLHVLHRLAPGRKWRLTVGHLNHQLRGRNSDADQKLVERAARRMQVPIIAERADILAMAAQAKGSIEMVARRVRHEFLARVARESKIPSVALAHHADDQVELFFLRLLRGAGADGLAGMQALSTSPVDDHIKLVRPLLGFTRWEIAQYARRERVAFREDATNECLDFMRNRVRRQLLPLLERNYQPALRRVILRTMDLLAAEADWSGEAAAEWLETRPPDFGRLHVAVQRRILQLQLIQEGIPPDFDLIERLRANPDKACSVGSDKQVRRDRAGRLVVACAAPQFEERGIELDLKTDRGVRFDEIEVSWRLKPVKGMAAITKSSGIERFDADVIGDRVVLRHWRRGDRFQPIGMASGVKLQDLFANAKVPKAERHQRLVATTAHGQIFWVEGLRMAEHFKLRPESRRVLEWKWQRAR